MVVAPSYFDILPGPRAMKQPQGQRPGYVPKGSPGLGSSRQTAVAGLDVQAQRGQLGWGAGRLLRQWLIPPKTAVCKARVTEGQTGYPGGKEQGTDVGRPPCSTPHRSVCSPALPSLRGSCEL